MIHDLIIVGGGPAGVAAGVYAARKKIRTVFVTYDWGGQSIVSPDIQNWIGDKSISGEQLAEKLKDHLLSYKGDFLEIKEGAKAERVDKIDQGFKVKLEEGAELEGKTILVATGAHRRKLVASGAEEFEQKGITYCATCDGPLFGGKDVVVIGGGNAGFETALQLLAYAKSVTLLHHREAFKADKITVDKVLSDPKMKAITAASTVRVEGDNFVKSLTYKDVKTGEEHTIPTEGVFVEIGLIPTTEFVKGLVELNSYGSIKVNPRTQATSLSGIWAAGDCADGLYHQNNIAAGDAVKALEDIYLYLHLKQ